MGPMGTEQRREGPQRPLRQPSETYTVEEGDTLASIAGKFYGREDLSENIARIAKENRLEQSNALPVGQELRIPAPPRPHGEQRGEWVFREGRWRWKSAAPGSPDEQMRRAQELALQAEQAMRDAQKAREEALRAAVEARKAEAEGRQAGEMEHWGQQVEQWEQSEAAQNWERDMENWGQQMERWGQELGQRIAGTGSGPVAGASPDAELPPVPPMPRMPAMPPLPAVPGMPEMHGPGGGAPPHAPMPERHVPGGVHVPSINAPHVEVPSIELPVIVPPAPPAKAADQEEAVSRVGFGPLPGDRFLEVSNPVGSITVRRGDQPEYVIRATVIGRARTQERAHEIAERLVVITDTGPQADGSERIIVKKPEGLSGGESYNVTLEVTAPREVRLKLHQAVGDIRLVGLRGSVEALAEVGTIRAIDVSGRVALTAKVGGIDYAAPADLSAKVQAKADLGGIHSELPLEGTKPHGFEMGSSAFGTIGRGEDDISLRTNTGSIRIRSSREAIPVRVEPHEGGRGGGAPGRAEPSSTPF